MRKGITPIVGIVLALIIFLIGGAMLNVAGGKAGDAINYMKGALGGCGLGCSKCISEPVSFDAFMAEMSKVANECNGDKTKCGKTLCMTAGFGDPGDYYRIDEYSLHDYNMDMFNNYLIKTSVVSWGANVFCEKTDGAWAASEIDPYYKGGSFDRSGNTGPLPNIKTADGTIICRTESAIHGEFAVAEGSKVKMNAKYLPNLIGHSVDMKVTIDGGTYTNDKTPSPQSECTPPDDTPCNTGEKPKWGYCAPIDESNPAKGGKCRTEGYCFAHPANCKTFNLECTKSDTENTCPVITTECTKPPAAIVENGYKTETAYITQPSLSEPQLAIYVIKDSQSGNSFIGNGKEKWYGTGTFCLFGPCEVSSTDPNAKVSVMVKDLGTSKTDQNKYEVTVLQGCF